MTKKAIYDKDEKMYNTNIGAEILENQKVNDALRSSKRSIEILENLEPEYTIMSKQTITSKHFSLIL